MLGAYAHQDVPFERLLEELSPERTLSRTPVFQVMFNMLNLEGSYAGGVDELEDSGLQPVDFDVELEVGAKFDLTLYVQELDEGLRFDATYDADLFDGDRVDGMMRQLAAVLGQAAGDPSLRLDDVSLLTDDARAALPDPRAPLRPESHPLVHRAFSARAAETPDAPALVGVDETWTYAQVEEASNRVARYLRTERIGRRDVVAVYARRGPWLPIALLGISKAGAAWTVLDPAYPAAALIDRMQIAMPRAWLQDASAGELHPELEAEVNAQPLWARLELGADAPDRDRARFAAASADPLAVEITPEDLAYLAFTSGTTGEPKAVAGTHRPLSHFFHWYADELATTAADRFTLLSGLGHDPLLRDIFAPLTTGGALHIPDPERIAEPGYLGGWLAEQAITVTHLTPAMGRLLASSDAVHLPTLRLAAFGGDVLTARDVASIRRLAPSVEVVNFYGATETPQAMGFHRVSAEPGGPDREPVGRGIDGVQLLVLTPAGRLAGIGEVGEIVVRTPYLARGYANDAAATAARFRENPFGGAAFGKVYYTGDLGRYRPDGTVEAAGRADRQVQVRGFRVEPGEVEAALVGHPRVRAAAVVPRAGADGGKTLAAYVVTRVEDAAAVLRPYLAARLPDYMVPTAFIRLDALPLTANGKLDVAALPDPERAAAEVYVAPRTAAEQVVAEIWAEVLGRERVGAEDDFFALGGHSLLATQVLSRVEQAFGVKLPVRALFEEPTVAALAARLEASGQGTLAAAMAELDGLSEEELMALLAETEGAEGG
jgi:amino acid adenylation domain-containing protein